MLNKSYKYLVVILFLLFALTSWTSAASLTQSQINAILGLLKSFGAPTEIVQQVESVLSGKNTIGTIIANVRNVACPNINRTLALGSTGKDVEELQRFLKALSYYTYPEITGYFGPVTERAVQNFQCQKLGICSGSPYINGYGVVGPKTRSLIFDLCSDDVFSGKPITGTPGSTQGGADTQEQTNMVAQYLFDEEVNNLAADNLVIDNTGNGNNGVLENGAKRYMGTREGGKLELDGVDDRVTIKSTDSLNNLDKFTLAAWIRPTEYAGLILRKGNTKKARFNFGLSSDGQLYLIVGYSDSNGVWKTAGNKIPLNTWTHVAVVYDGESRMPIFYINGKRQPVFQISEPVGTWQADTPYMYIGNNHDFVNRAAPVFDTAFEGRMDKIYIYNAPLDDYAILNIAAAPAGPIGVPTQ